LASLNGFACGFMLKTPFAARENRTDVLDSQSIAY
jgi:hypothetical protein